MRLLVLRADLLKEATIFRSGIAGSPVYKNKLFRFNRLNDVPQVFEGAPIGV